MFSLKLTHKRACMQAASPLLPSFAFKAPERILSGANALSDDIFSLGALLFFALTGRQPFPVAEGEIQEAWASRVAHLDLDIPQHGAHQDLISIDRRSLMFREHVPRLRVELNHTPAAACPASIPVCRSEYCASDTA